MFLDGEGGVVGVAGSYACIPSHRARPMWLLPEHDSRLGGDGHVLSPMGSVADRQSVRLFCGGFGRVVCLFTSFSACELAELFF